MIINCATKEDIHFIKRQVVVDLQRRYNIAELRETFWEQQNRLCFLCERHLQDCGGAFAQIEHVIPIRLYVDFFVNGWTLEKVLANVNDLKNLRLSHVSCGGRKSYYDLEEIPEDFFESVEVKTLTEEEIHKRRHQLSERGHAGGRKRFELYGSFATPEGRSKAGRRNVESGWAQQLGQKAVESGHLDRIRELPQSKEGQRQSGLTNGRKAAETGRIQLLGHIHGRIQGRQNVESGLLASIRTPESLAKGGRISGRKAVESGQLARIRELPQTKEAARRNIARAQELPQTKEAQRRNGRKSVENGHLARIRNLPQAKEAQRQNGRRQGRKKVESGEWARIHELPQSKEARRRNLARARELPQTKAALREARRRHVESGGLAKALHIRWHINRGLKKVGCKFCFPVDLLAVA